MRFVRRQGRRFASALALAGATLVAVPSQAQVTLPDTGVDLPAHITAATTALAAVVVAVLGAWFAFRGIRWGISWIRNLIKG